MKKILYILLTTLFLISFVACTTETVSDARQEKVLPRIYPDYLGVTIPVNIAPLNFCMEDETALRIDAVIADRHGHSLHSQGEESVDFDIDDWHQLLSQNRGDSLTITVSAKYDDGWHTYRSFPVYVSPDSIDYGICYRLIAPGHEVWSKMGIYERDLSTFDERPLIENTQFEGCVNCHSFNRGNSADMSLHIRGKHGATLLRHNDGPFAAYNTKTDQTLGFCVYPYWHPSGRYIAYSTNNTRQGFHVGGHKIIEVMDLASDMQVYDVANNQLLVCEALKGDSAFETFPAFSPDGRTLYFSVARPKNYPTELKEMYYSLCSIAFDPESGTEELSDRTQGDVLQPLQHRLRPRIGNLWHKDRYPGQRRSLAKECRLCPAFLRWSLPLLHDGRLRLFPHLACRVRPLADGSADGREPSDDRSQQPRYRERPFVEFQQSLARLRFAS